MFKNILITGSTDGIGKLLALRLANEGHHIYVHGRNTEKVSAACKEIKNTTKNENISGFVADLSDIDAVKDMAKQVKNEIDKLDVLVNNAGAFKLDNIYNKTGLDIRFVVNYMAPYVLTTALLPLLKNGNEARVINLSSAAQSSINYDAVMGKQSISDDAAYAQSKLALTMWSFNLAKNLKNEVSVIAVNPGSLLNTKMAARAYGQHWSPAEKGSNILYDLSMGESYKDITGKYYDNDNGEFAHAHPDAYNEVAISNLLNKTEQLINH